MTQAAACFPFKIEAFKDNAPPKHQPTVAIFALGPTYEMAPFIMDSNLAGLAPPISLPASSRLVATFPSYISKARTLTLPNVE